MDGLISASSEKHESLGFNHGECQCPNPATEALRDAARRAGIEFERGYRRAGMVEDEDTVTCLHAGDAWETSLTFEESADGELWCMDTMTPAQAIGAFLAGREET